MAIAFTPHDPLLPPVDALYAAEAARPDRHSATWPVDRSAMLSPRAIVERLIGDILALAPDETSPAVTGPALQDMGWTLAQLQAHSAAALVWLAHWTSVQRASDNANEVA
jgi:hypothetical protein